MRDSGRTIIKTARSGRKTTERTARHAIKTAERSSRKTIKTVQRTAKTATRTAKTAGQTAKTAQKTAQATVKATQRAVQTARATAKAAATTAEAAAKATVAAIKAAIADMQELIAAIAAGGWVVLVVVLVICMIGLLIASPFGIFFSDGGGSPDAVLPTAAMAQINSEYADKLTALQAEGTYDRVEIQGRPPSWAHVFAMFAAKTAGAVNGESVAVLDPDTVEKLRTVFWDITKITTETKTVDHPATDDTDAWTEMVLTITVPRDRKGEFEPQLLKKNQTSISQDIEEKILSMYAKGMSTGDIEAHIRDIYGLEVSDTTVSRITNKVIPVAKEWQQRPLESVYAVVFLDGIHYHVRSEGQVMQKAVYIAIGIDLDGRKAVLGMCG